MNTKLKPYIRLVLAFGLCASIATCNPFLDFLHQLRVDTVEGADDIAVILLILGAVGIASGGGRAIAGFASVACAAFIALGADPIATWLQSHH